MTLNIMKLQKKTIWVLKINNKKPLFYTKGYENNWIQPTWTGNGGLKKEYVDKAIKILKGE